MPGRPLYFCAHCFRSSRALNWWCSGKDDAPQTTPLGPPVEPSPATLHSQPPRSPSVSALANSSWMPHLQSVGFPQRRPSRSRRAMEPPVPLDGRVQLNAPYWNPIWCPQLVFNRTVCRHWRTGKDVRGPGQPVVSLGNTCWFLSMAVRLGVGTRILAKLRKSYGR